MRLVRGGWPAVVERALRRLVSDDPRVVLDPRVTDDAFSRAMACMQVGDTIKITGRGRHEAPDRLLLDHVDLAGAVVVDLGASDGSTSLELLDRLPDVRGYVIADLYLHADAVRVAGHVLFLDADGAVVVVAGRRLLLWPAGSRVLRALARLVVRVARRRGPLEPVLLLCPSARARVHTDPRVTAAVHDVFTVWPGPAPDVIKVANVLRRLYFSDADISRALSSLHAGLPDGGHLLVVDNPRAKVASRGGLYRREEGRFVRVAATDPGPEIDDLVLQVRAAAIPAPRAASERRPGDSRPVG